MVVNVDNHSHIIFADIGEMVGGAQAKGVAELSVTEHVSQFKELRASVRFGSAHSNGRIFENLREYEMEFKKVGELGAATRIRRGLEVDFAPRFESKVAEFVNQAPWDILLCSVHEFENAQDIERDDGVKSAQESYSRWREYLRLEELAVQSDFLQFDVLAHPVRISRVLRSLPADIEDLLFDLASLAKRRRKSLELNGNDIDYAPHLVRMLANACFKAGCKVSLGSDAHYPRDVFRNMGIAQRLVEEFKLETWSQLGLTWRGQ